MVSASPAGAGLVMSLDSGRVVVGAGGVGEEGAGHLFALSFDAVAGDGPWRADLRLCRR